MMRWIVESGLRLRLIVVAGAAVLGYFGVTELRNMPLDVVPEFSRPYVEVQTEALGLSAAEVEAMLTVPMEADLLNGVAWVEEIKSESIPGLSSIVMYFEPGTDLLVARQMVQERLTGIHALPNVSTPPRMMQPLSSSSRFMKIGMSSDTHSLIDLSVLAQWTIVPRLNGVHGVANVSIWGQRNRQLQVQVDPARLMAENVTLHQVIESTGNALWVSPLSYLDASVPGTGGWVETPNQRLGIQHIASISTPADLSQIVVEGTTLRLGDLATVVEDHQPLIGDALIEGAPALMLVVEKFPWANTVDVTRGVEEAVEALKLGLPGVQMDTSLYRPATYLEMAGANLKRTALIGSILALVALLGLLLNWRSALVAALAVALSALAAGAVLYLRGTALNMMVLAGLLVALAVLIDDAIVATLRISRRLGEGGGESRARLVVQAVLETRSPLMYATVVVLMTIVPVFFVSGVISTFSREIATSYTIALLASLVVALVATPTLSLLFLRGRAGESSILSGLGNGLAALSAGFARIPGVPVLAAIAGVAVLAAIVMVRPSGAPALPHFQERDILVDFEAAPGSSGETLRAGLSRAAKELNALPGVRRVSAHLGRAVLSDRVEHVDSGELWVSVDPTADYNATVAAIRETAFGFTGFDVDVDTYLDQAMKEDMGTEGGLTVRVYGEDLDEVRRKAEEVRSVIAKVDGVVEPEVVFPLEHPNLEIEVDIARARKHGLKPGDIRRAATTLLGGIQVGSLFEQQKVFNVVVWGTPGVRRNMTDVQNLLIDTPSGDHVRLAELADLRIAAAPKVINRESVSEYVDVIADVRGRDHMAVAADVQKRIRKDMQFPLEYRAEVLGGFVQRAEATQRVRATAIAAAIAVLLLLQVAFGSWRIATLLFLSLPLAVVGGFVVASAGGTLASLGSTFGILAVFGLAVRNGISLITHLQGLQHESGGPLSIDLIRRGTADQLVPILATTIVTAVAVLPFALFGNIAGHEILYPMAIFILGGLVTVTLVTILVVPALYLRYGTAGETLDLS